MGRICGTPALQPHLSDPTHLLIAAWALEVGSLCFWFWITPGCLTGYSDFKDVLESSVCCGHRQLCPPHPTDWPQLLCEGREPESALASRQRGECSSVLAPAWASAFLCLPSLPVRLSNPLPLTLPSGSHMAFPCKMQLGTL